MALVLACGGVAAAEPFTSFEEHVVPFIQQHCVECHRPDNLKGDLNIARFEKRDQAIDAIAVWLRMAKRVETKEMPPRRTEGPPDDVRTAFVNYVRELEKADVDCDQVASEESVNWFPGYVMSRRLNRAEYENTLRDLLGMKVEVAHLFPADGAGGEGFDTNGKTLYLSAIQMEKYVQAADLAIESVLPTMEHIAATVTADEHRDFARTRALLVTAEPGPEVDARSAAMLAVSRFLERAWRRPVQADEVGRIMAMFDQAQARGDSYLESLKLAYKAALVSPHFLFLVEPRPEIRGEYPLGDFELASRLSYFLWSSMPDEELFGAARAGTLQDINTLEYQIERMLRHERSKALGEQFASQWLEITPLGETKLPDPNAFPEFDAALAADMREEMVVFFHETVRHGGSLLNILDSDHTYVNERLAGLYGFDSVRGGEFQRVQFADASRGGVTGMAAVLTVTSHPLRTSPVLRGKWVLEQLLGDRVPPPPPNVPALPEDEAHAEDTRKLTLREQMELHRENPDCASCHSTMDPIGFGMENYDPIGRWRFRQAGSPIDAAGELPSGETFAGPAELRAMLMAKRDKVMRNLSRKMLGYALGRSLTRYDNCVIDECVHRLKASDYESTELFKTIAMSYPFRYRFSGGEKAEVSDE